MRRILFIVLVAWRASAHDFWIEPSTFRPEVGKTFTASLRVGEDFAGDAIPRTASLIEAFVVRDAAGSRAINGFENQDPAGFVRMDEAGTGVIGYESKSTRIELTPQKFRQFLREEGISGITAPDAPHRERFFRYAKSIVNAGSKQTRFDLAFGYRLELVPLTDPAGPAPLRVSVSFEQKPLAGALVTAIARDDGTRVTARSDDQGVVVLNLRGGVWLLATVHLIPAPPESDVEWETLWASLTFER